MNPKKESQSLVDGMQFAQSWKSKNKNQHIEIRYFDKNAHGIYNRWTRRVHKNEKQKYLTSLKIQMTY